MRDTRSERKRGKSNSEIRYIRHAVLQSNTISIHSTHSNRSRKKLRNGSVYCRFDCLPLPSEPHHIRAAHNASVLNASEDLVGFSCGRGQGDNGEYGSRDPRVASISKPLFEITTNAVHGLYLVIRHEPLFPAESPHNRQQCPQSIGVLTKNRSTDRRSSVYQPPFLTAQHLGQTKRTNVRVPRSLLTGVDSIPLVPGVVFVPCIGISRYPGIIIFD